ncbi:EpsG family protein [Holdemania massiliensis]|uniref:EpsG family protein n=1 Tax=Holdemania massiliensis TaxID=1468449 RepID=UPI001F06E4B0|nr:EpsG family protein [Holdemania massiliensis]MCH1941239.1 EpsG family protein [Holdemania massiliensis]
MNDRYLQMFSWGLLYSIFSLTVVLLYKTLMKPDRIFVLKIKEKKRSILHISDLVIYIILTTVSAIRLNTGSDFYNYYTYFNQINENFSSIKEVLFQSQGGYWILSYIIKIFTDYQYAIFVVIAILSYAYLFYIIRKESDDPSCTLLCYLFLGYYAYSNNILKQYIAMMFVMSAYLNFNDKNYFKCLILSFLAVSFHYSAGIILIVMFLAKNIKPTFGKYRAAILAGIAGAVSLNLILTIFIKIIPSASGYAKYLDWRRSGQLRLIAAVIGMSIIYALLTFLVLKYKDKIKTKNERRYKEIIFLIIGLCINIISIRQWIINRIAIYFYQFIILILPTMLGVLKSKERKKVKIVLYTLMFLYMMFSSIFLGENEYYSYNTVFSGDPPISDVQYNMLHGWRK